MNSTNQISESGAIMNMSKFNRYYTSIIIIGLISTTAALGETYKLPTGVSGTAKLLIEKGFHNSGAGNAGNQVYAVSQTNICKDMKILGRFAPFFGAKPKAIEIEGGKSTIVLAQTSYIYSGYDPQGVRFTTNGCSHSLSFTPLVGEVYKIVQKSENGQQCRLEVTNQRTGFAPEDARLLESVRCFK